MPKIRHNNPSLGYLIDFWSKYCVLEKWHVEWARMHLHIPSGLRKDEVLYAEGEHQSNVYLVTKGLLARIQVDTATDKRKIFSIALPGMALMTTDHLYSATPSIGDITVLRSNSLVIKIPYQAIKAFKENEQHIDTLIDVLGNRKRKQIMVLRRVTHGLKPFESYLHFADEIPELHRILTNQECADLLGISIATVKRANKTWINAKTPLK